MAGWKLWVLGITAIIIDIAVYAFLGLMLMSYDDLHNGAEPDYETWASYKILDKAAVIGIWFWNIVNILFWGHVVYRIIKAWKPLTNRSKSTKLI